ncbi:MAG: glycosyltransferase, partial [Flavobacteriaceae bacterium]
MVRSTQGKKNICLTINSLAKGGAEKQCLLLAKALRSHHNVYLAVLNPTTQDPYYRKVVDEEKIQVVFLSRNPIVRMVKLAQFLKRKKVEVVFSFLPVDTIMSAVCGWLAGVPYRFGGIRNSYLPKGKHMILRAVNNHVLHYTIANNYAAYRSALAFGFKENVMVIHNGIGIRPLISRQGRPTNETTIISVGRLVKQKDYETALKSVARLKKMLPAEHTLRYRIVGYGE